jgi:DNA-binding YbaB/EbfC family protein
MAKGAFRGGGYGGGGGGFRPGGGGGGGMNMDMMKQAQKMQADMLKVQEELEQKEFAATSGGGVVTATVNGKKELISVKILPDAVDPDDVEMLEDLIVAAVNEAIRKAEEASTQSMAKVTGGMNLPF